MCIHGRIEFARRQAGDAIVHVHVCGLLARLQRAASHLKPTLIAVKPTAIGIGRVVATRGGVFELVFLAGQGVVQAAASDRRLHRLRAADTSEELRSHVHLIDLHDQMDRVY